MIIDIIAQRLYDYDKKNYELKLESINNSWNEALLGEKLSQYHKTEKEKLEQSIEKITKQTPSEHMREAVEQKRESAMAYVRNSQYYLTTPQLSEDEKKEVNNKINACRRALALSSVELASKLAKESEDNYRYTFATKRANELADAMGLDLLDNTRLFMEERLVTDRKHSLSNMSKDEFEKVKNNAKEHKSLYKKYEDLLAKQECIGYTDMVGVGSIIALGLGAFTAGAMTVIANEPVSESIQHAIPIAVAGFSAPMLVAGLKGGALSYQANQVKQKLHKNYGIETLDEYFPKDSELEQNL